MSKFPTVEKIILQLQLIYYVEDIKYLAVCVGNCVFPVGVNCAPVFWAHQIGVYIVGIGATTSSITVGVIAWCNIVTGVQSGHHGVFVAFIGVIFRAEVVVDKVGITVVIPACVDKFESRKNNIFLQYAFKQITTEIY